MPLDENELKELEIKVHELSLSLEKINAAWQTLKWIVGLFCGGTILILFNLVVRAIDNESQLKVDTGQITGLQASIALVESKGYQEITAMKLMIDGYIRAENVKDEEFIREIEAVKTRQRQRLEKEDRHDPPNF